MTSYRVSRRSFMAGVGGAVGLQILLSNLEAAAEGMKSPPRFLMTFWPTGTPRQRFLPTGGRTDFTISPILAPFEKAGLREDLIILYGLAHRNTCPGGGGSEAGTVFGSTGADSEGTRANGGEGDDAVAGGPSFDQIFLKRAAARLGRPGVGYINTIGDARVSSYEISSQCLSYSYDRRQIEAARGGMINENIPLMPLLKPADAYAALFAGFVPGSTEKEELVRNLKKRKSVLDSALRELTRLHGLAPASQREKIDAHADAIRKLEERLAAELDAAGNTDCSVPPPPDPGVRGLSGSAFEYGNPKVDRVDDVWLEQVGKLHLAVIRAAFQCDLIRVATFQWCPATNRVAFKGLYPGDPEASYVHHPLLNNHGGSQDMWAGAPPADPTQRNVYEFACNAQTWFYQKTVDALVEFKNAKDAFGGSLLDHTIVPFITDEADPSDARQPLPALIVGGRKLGMVGGQFLNSSPIVNHNAMWLTIAQAYFPGQDPAQVLADEAFMKRLPAAPLEGLWKAPA